MSKTKPTQVRSITYNEPQQTLLQTIGKINGFNSKMIFDSGAMSSVISKRLADDYKLPKSDEEVNVVMADGRVEQASLTELVTISIFGISVEVKMIILDNNDKPVLIGLDWMSEAGAIIDIGNKSIKFGARSYNFNIDECEDDDELNNNEVNQCAVAEIDEDLEEELDLVDHVYENEDKTDNELLEQTLTTITHLNSNEKQALSEVIKEYRCIFADKLSDLREPAKLSKFKIITTDEIPIHKPIYRTDRKTRDIIEVEIQKFLEAGLIRHSTSPYSAPVVPVKKRNDPQPRTCIDYRGLNAKTIKNGAPIPRQDDIFDDLSESNVFTELDLKAAFHQQEMDEESIAKTAFSTWSGHYEWLRKPMGVVNGTVDQSQQMAILFKGMKFVAVYVDDLVIHSKTFEEHLIHLRAVFELLRKYMLKINRKKCDWVKAEIKLLGHIISKDGLKMDPEKIKAIQEWKKPSKVVHIQQFMGITGYYRRFIKTYADIAAPLTNLVKKTNKWLWSSECEAAFNEL